MKSISNDYKNTIKKFGKQIDAKITYTSDGTSIELGMSQLNAITPSYDGALLKSVMKKLVIDSNTEIPVNTIVNCQFGLLIDEEEGTYEYIDYGNYIVKEVEKNEDTNSYTMICYDKMLNAMKNYQSMNITYPITIKNYLTTIADFLQLGFYNANDTFANYDKEITKELYLKENGDTLNYTFRDVLDELAQVTASTICINESTNKLEVRYITDTEDTIDSRYLKDVNIKFGEKYGPVNSIVLSRAGNSDNIYLKDDESIEENGLCEIKISENQIMNGNDRDQYLSDILDQLNGLEYYINDFSSTGITYYELCDMYNIEIDNNTYQCVMLNDEVKISQGLIENIHTEIPEESETDYKKADKTDRKINQTYLMVDKQKGEIEALATVTNQLNNELQNYYTKEQMDQLIINAENGVTNTFSEAGGNNIFRNTGLWFESGDDNNPYEFWYSNVKKINEESASNRSALLLQNTTLYQEQTVPNGKYTVSFKYKKVKPVANISVVINGISYSLSADTETTFVQVVVVTAQTIKIQFISNVDDSCEIYDLMVNAGQVKLAYSQNQNETTTDTVNISKGITITSSDYNTTFKANADGIRTLDNVGNKLAEFTDKGMTTKEIIVEGKSEISGILIQEINNQTWITKI